MLTFTYNSCIAEWYSSEWLISRELELSAAVVYNSSDFSKCSVSFRLSIADWYKVVSFVLFKDKRSFL